MAIFETFTKRQRRLERAGKQDVYRYDVLPQPFRIQVVNVWNRAIGGYSINSYSTLPSNSWWDVLHDTVAQEHGVFFLGEDPYACKSLRCINYFLRAETSGALDILELSFLTVDRGIRDMSQYDRVTSNIRMHPDEAIVEINARLLEHGIGYQYLGGKVVKLDSQFAHAQIVVPALALLNAEGFDGPADEFIKAFDHYRHGRAKEAVADALKSFESTMKAICAVRRWQHPANATARPLIEILIKSGLIPPGMESHFTALRAALESGLPTLSNSTSRHGQGPTPKEVPPHLVGYALHLAASNIIFLVEAHKALK